MWSWVCAPRTIFLNAFKLQFYFKLNPGLNFEEYPETKCNDDVILLLKCGPAALDHPS